MYNFIVYGNRVYELSLGNTIHTLLIGAEFIDTENKNLRYDAFWSSTSDDNENDSKVDSDNEDSNKALASST